MPKRKKKKTKSRPTSEAQSDLEDSGLEQSDHELQGVDQSDDQWSGAEQSDHELSGVEQSDDQPSEAEQLDDEISGAEQSGHELSRAEQSDDQLSGAEQSDHELSRVEQLDDQVLGAEQSDDQLSGTVQSDPEQSEQSEAEQSDKEQSAAEQSDTEVLGPKASLQPKHLAEKVKRLHGSATIPLFEELLSSEAIGEGTVVERKKEFLSRLAAFTERIYKPDCRVNYCKFCKKTYVSDHSFDVHLASMHSKEKKFQCSNCNRNFGLERQLKRHQEYHCQAAYKCLICLKHFSSTAELNEHKLMTHKKGKTEKCEVCGQCFTTQRFLKSHKKIHSSETPFLCTVKGCEESFQTKFQRELHVDKKHTTKEADFRHKCSGCKKKFQTPFDLLVHRRQHKGDESHPEHTFRKPFLYKCPDCGKEIKYRQLVKPHRIMHAKGLTPLKERAPKKDCYPCKICKEQISMKKDLLIHMRTVHSMINRCSVCDQMFSSQILLRKHVSTVHSMYRCLECDATFDSSIERRQHRLAIHAVQVNSDNGHICKFCNTSMRSAKELLGHMRFVHSVYKCFHCPQEFISDRERQAHLRKLHYKSALNSFRVKEPRKPKTSWPCKHCDLVFSSASRHDEHVMTLHKGYRCKKCDIVFPNQYALTKHRRLMHRKLQDTAGVKLYKCSDCSEVFQTYFQKRQHRKIMHPRLGAQGSENGQKLKKANCQVCGRSVASEWHLSEHMKTHA